MERKTLGCFYRYPQLSFNYKDPERNFDRSSVKGLVCKLFTLQDSSTATAIEVIAGGKLYNVITDTEVTGQKILKNGKLARRVTIIPLNQIAGRSIDNRTVQQAEALVGVEGVGVVMEVLYWVWKIRKLEWVLAVGGGTLQTGEPMVPFLALYICLSQTRAPVSLRIAQKRLNDMVSCGLGRDSQTLPYGTSSELIISDLGIGLRPGTHHTPRQQGEIKIPAIVLHLPVVPDDAWHHLGSSCALL
ncbi:Structural maintenance of chromosomes protein 2 [Portunus trituberculatus]|uniref:Structural maintenance of chromosomes protein 2 n=1 Tax=Portunus trituberculatus TaxID=210409 RepID=A0A5B7EWQ1_PORTR|nr:Structural maintenance of chromosomes protein 2 [Portunus trituberculatus]